AKVYQDIGRRDDSFQHLFAGNALKRRQLSYDETATAKEFDRIRAVFTPDLMQRLRDAGDPSSRPIFVIGMPRSGTTLIEQILASHPHVFGGGELLILSKAVAAIGSARDDGLSFPEVLPTLSADELR